MARRRKKKNVTVEGGGSPSWMTSFSDLMTLLLTFFILLFSMSSVSDTKFNAASASMNLAFVGQDGGLLPEEEAIVSEKTGDYEKAEDLNAAETAIPPELLDLYEEMEQSLQQQDLETTIGIDVDSEGIYLEVKDSILFDSGSAEIVATGQKTLNTLAEMINQVENEIIVEGYTDDVPMVSGKYESNWELSTARALSVVRYLSESQNVQPTRLSARGYGEHRPIVPNDSDANRAKNRRVNIVVLYDQMEEEN